MSKELILAVDFGTTNTVAVASRGGRDPRIVTIDGAPRMPSAVFATAGGELVVGGDALRMARGAPSRLEPRPKSHIDEGELLLGDTTLDVATAVRAVLAKVCAEAGRQFGGTVDHLVLTHPADWGSLRMGTITRAATGLAGRLSLVPEPVAAAAQHGVPAGSALLVLDFGGGTCDAAAVRHDGSGYRVLACAGLPDLGGDDLDQRLVDHVLALRPALAESLAAPGADGARDALLLRQDARTAKELLSRHDRAEIAGAGVEPVTIERAEFDRLVAADVARAAGLLDEVRRAAGTERLDFVYLVGGSSRLRPLSTAVHERTGLAVHPADEPETSVAWGALSLISQAGAEIRPVPTPSSRPNTAPPPARRRGLIAGVAAAVVVAVVAAVLATRDGEVPGTARPVEGAAPGTAVSEPPSEPAATSALEPAKPGEEVVGEGEPNREVVPAGQTGRYEDGLDEVTIEVGLDDVAVTDQAAPAGYRWVRAQVTAKHLGKAGDAPFDSVDYRIGLLDDRGQHINSPPGTAEGCPGAPPDDEPLQPGASVTACRDFILPRATPVAAVVFGDEPRTFGVGARSLLWQADIPAAGEPARLPEPVGELGGDPAEVEWVGDFVTIQFDLVDKPSAYAGEVELQPGTRLVVLRALVSATGTGEVDNQLFKYLDVVDDRGLRVLDAWDDFYELVDCPSLDTIPAGETEVVCAAYIVDADTPIAGFALGLDPDKPEAWSWWPNRQS
ncbi:Hsp70 family protein [Actinophytocola sp.]|uniref:Hsp70 family protein n=1 Tax=Actinophytocola sp. TaxID=1872138 RepID=UPI003D6B3F5E